MPKATQTKADFSTGGVVWDDAARKFLLIHVENLSGAHVWTFPKGHPEENETAEQAALREVCEETGWKCEALRPITDVHYMYTYNHILYKKTVRWFLMRPLEELKGFDPEEVLACRWVTPDEALALVSYGSDKELLKKTALLL